LRQAVDGSDAELGGDTLSRDEGSQFRNARKMKGRKDVTSTQRPQKQERELATGSSVQCQDWQKGRVLEERRVKEGGREGEKSSGAGESTAHAIIAVERRPNDLVLLNAVVKDS
jgi:hypothetical protein